MKEKLRAGIIFKDGLLPYWEYKALSDIVGSDYAEIVLVIENKTGSDVPAKNEGGLSAALLRMLDKLDRQVFGRHTNYDHRKNSYDLLDGIPVITLTDTKMVHMADTVNDSIVKLKEIKPDIILQFGHQYLPSEVIEIPRYGVLVYSADIDLPCGGITPGIFEVLNKDLLTVTSLLLIDTYSKPAEPVFVSTESTCPYSINVNRNNILWRNSLFMPRVLAGIHRDGKSYLDIQKERYEGSAPRKNKYSDTPGILKTAGYLFKYANAVAGSILRKIFYTDAFNWQVLLETGDSQKGLLPDFSRFRTLITSGDIFWADPFVISEDDHYYIFVEEFVYRDDRAHISVLTLDKEGNITDARRIIENTYHMSYPQVFDINGVFYMLPETAQNGTIELYRCTDFPYKWEFDRNLMENVSAVDSTLFFLDGIWWMFTTIDQTTVKSGNSTELFLYYTENIFSDQWKSHPLNPVISDIRTARPAGKIFINDGKIYRPSQDCTGRYGVGFNLFEIITLNKTDYRENLISEVKPEWDKTLKGTHTLNSDKDLIVIDVYRYRKRLI